MLRSACTAKKKKKKMVKRGVVGASADLQLRGKQKSLSDPTRSNHRAEAKREEGGQKGTRAGEMESVK